MLELNGISKRFGGAGGVENVSLEVREGEIFSLLGPSGCGKTTLLRLIAGFESPTSGSICQDGQRVDPPSPHERPFNMVFQSYALFPHLNVWENVAFGLRVKRVPIAEISLRVEEALQLVQLREHGLRSVETLSGGQQQRVALARALVNRPKVLLLDEPLSALDLKLRQQMQIELAGLQRRLKIAFIFVTHDQEEALTLSDRIAVMNAGRVEQVGTPQEIYDSPRSRFVADFIGSINQISGTVVSKVDSSFVAVKAPSGLVFYGKPGGSDRNVHSDPTINGSNSRTATLLVRPEKIRLGSRVKSGMQRSAPASTASTASAPPFNSLEGTVRRVFFKGQWSEVHVELHDSEATSLVAVTQKLGPDGGEVLRLVPGDTCMVEWSAVDSLVLGEGLFS